ncbi:site-specific integrase [Actinoplanes aureus]|uniref:Tyrosine-type recombinase/integrase n=1 Tax=Actinoplanes aureus TaxID=2792083 RepID=A0A931CMG8_9ACTN|nr:site-specific integrase [Actinoplanes aureus]MBG0564893.1 tyrosine-type recombinase/integrase [Actinoplanes aureus]MBG0569096.1 tyrosine-type recombinase/integrase [Actinoplanes aureus]
MARPQLPIGTAGKVRHTQVGKSTWRARCSFRDYDGVTRDVERTGATKAAAEAALKIAIRDRTHENRDAAISPDTRLSVVTEEWWKTYVIKEGSLGSRRIYREQIDNHILPQVGSLKCREFSVALAERALRRVENVHGPSITKTVRSVLSNICAFAARMGAMDRNPVRETSPVSIKPRKAPRALTAVQFRQLRAWVSYSSQAVRRGIPEIIDFLGATGERLGECLAVTGDTLDVGARTVEIRGTVVRHKGVGVCISRFPKTEAGFRTLTLPDWVMPTVECLLANAVDVVATVVRLKNGVELVIPPTVSTAGRRRSAPPLWLQEMLDGGKSWTERVVIVFPSSVGTLRDPSNVANDIKDAFEFAGLDDDTSHLLRKTVATQMDDAGVPTREIADQLGHARPSMTSDVYLGRSRKSTRGATALVDFAP